MRVHKCLKLPKPKPQPSIFLDKGVHLSCCHITLAFISCSEPKIALLPTPYRATFLSTSFYKTYFKGIHSGAELSVKGQNGFVMCHQCSWTSSWRQKLIVDLGLCRECSTMVFLLENNSYSQAGFSSGDWYWKWHFYWGSECWAQRLSDQWFGFTSEYFKPGGGGWRNGHSHELFTGKMSNTFWWVLSSK